MGAGLRDHYHVVCVPSGAMRLEFVARGQGFIKRRHLRWYLNITKITRFDRPKMCRFRDDLQRSGLGISERHTWSQKATGRRIYSGCIVCGVEFVIAKFSATGCVEILRRFNVI